MSTDLSARADLAKPSSASSAVRILVCDDSRSDLSYVVHLLQREGHADITALNDSRDVLPALAAHDFDLLVLDVEMPHVDGIELTRLVRKRRSEAELPILVITGTQADETRNPALAAGANDYLHKPIDPIEMTLRVKNLLAVAAVHRQNLCVHRQLEAQVAARTAKLNMLIDNGVMLSMTRDRTELLRHILKEGQRLLNCEGGTLYLVTDSQPADSAAHAAAPPKALRFAMRTRSDELPTLTIPLIDPVTGGPNEHHVSTYAANHNRSVLIDDVYQDARFDLSGTRRFDTESRYRTVSMLTVPMSARGGEVIGVLQFINAIDPLGDAVVPFAPELVGLVEALAAQAAVALDNLNLVQAQKALMESIIRMLATAIDAKSRHTGRHCERVPELALMLAEAACSAQTGPLADFRFNNEEEWQEFRIGAWLHDCGKVTTPEYVIDKATKLETLYNRIHEVRMRFEVLLRDAEIERLRAMLGGRDKAQADAAFEATRAQLMDDFAFIADCNVGGESMDAGRLSRLAQIAQTRWMRHFDDRIGVSSEEAAQAAQEPVPLLPASEPLLADRPRHVIARPADQQLDPAFGFKMDVPEHLYNRGELYNLGVQRGTLTREERYKINEHMVQTVMMLERMPFPPSLRRVPEYASTHHETLNGTGYPRRLSGSDLSVPSRIMAIADVFEALTASDRPYKSPKALSESLTILHYMKKSGHIDPDLFDLFLTSGVYRRYAQKHLAPQQIDEVDITAFLGPVRPALVPAGAASTPERRRRPRPSA